MRRGLSYFYIFLMILTVLVISGASRALSGQLNMQQRNEYLKSVLEVKTAFESMCSSNTYMREVTLTVPKSKDMLVMSCDKVLSADKLDYSAGGTLDAKTTGYFSFSGASVLEEMKIRCRKARGCDTYELNCVLVPSQTKCNPNPCNKNVLFANTQDLASNILVTTLEKTEVKYDMIICGFPMRASGVFGTGQYKVRLSVTSTNDDREVIFENVIA